MMHGENVPWSVLISYSWGYIAFHPVPRGMAGVVEIVNCTFLNHGWLSTCPIHCLNPLCTDGQEFSFKHRGWDFIVLHQNKYMVYDCIEEALPLRHHRLAPFSKALYLTPLLLAAFHHGRMGRHALCSLNAEGLNKYNLQKIEYANGRPKQKIDENSCSTIIERVSLLVKTPKESENFAQNSTTLIYPLLLQWPLHPWVSTYVFIGSDFWGCPFRHSSLQTTSKQV